MLGDAGKFRSKTSNSYAGQSAWIFDNINGSILFELLGDGVPHRLLHRLAVDHFHLGRNLLHTRLAASGGDGQIGFAIDCRPTCGESVGVGEGRGLCTSRNA